MDNTKSYRIFTFFNYIILGIIGIVTIYPFLYVVSQSFSSQSALYNGEVWLFPVDFTVSTYREVMKDPYFWISYKNTIIYTVGGTFMGLALTTMFAYALSKNRLMGKKFLIPLAVFTMFFTGGLIPNYLLITNLGMRNTMWAVIIPGALSTYNMLIMKTFFTGLPKELEEAASIDGMNTYGILFKIILPLSKAIMATMALFYAVAFWNTWFNPFIYLDDRDKYPMALVLRNLVAGSSNVNELSSVDGQTLTPTAVKAATMVLASAPILCVYPFIQKYFVSGVMLGSVKG